MRRALTGPLSFGLSKAIASPEGVGVPAWVLSGAALDLDFAEVQGYNSLDRSKLTPDSILTYTSPSPKLVYGDDGVLRYAPHNLCPQSQTFDNAGWTKFSTTVVANQTTAPDGTLTADLVYPTTTGSGRQIRVQLNQTSGVNAIIRVRAKYAGIRWLSFGNPRANAEADVASFDLVNGVVGTVGAHIVSTSMVDLGDGWYECTTVGPCDGSDYVLFLLRENGNGTDGVTANGTDGIYLWGAELKLFPVHDSPYIPTTTAAVYSLPIDHDPITFNPLGVLIEEQRTNLLTYSEQFDNAAWSKGAVTVTANAVASPDGTTTADKIVETAATSTHNISQTATIVTATVYTYSVYAKAGERSWVCLEGGSGAGGYTVWFNLATGAVGTILGTTAGNVSIVALPDGWYRCIVTDTTTGTTGVYRNYVCDADNNQSYTGNGTSGLYLWGAQLEAGAFPTSYIPTVASQVTRAADQVSVLTSAFGYNAAEGSVMAELDAIFSAGAIVRDIFRLTNAAQTDYIRTYSYPNRGGFNIVDDSVHQADIGSSGEALSNGVPFKIATAWAANDFAKTVNGLSVSTDTSGTVADDITTARIGSNLGFAAINGHIKRLTYFPTRKSNAELQALTS